MFITQSIYHSTICHAMLHKCRVQSYQDDFHGNCEGKHEDINRRRVKTEIEKFYPQKIENIYILFRTGENWIYCSE